MTRNNANSQRGQALILITLSAILLFAVVGLAVDIGWAHFRQDAAQAAADAAALAGAQFAQAVSSSPVCGTSGVVCQAATACSTNITSPATTTVQAACLYASANGFKATGSQNVTIAANTTTPFASAAVKYWITASVTETETELFSSVLGNSALKAGATATAALIPAAGGCVYVMQPSGSSVTNSGNALISSGCGIYINSSGPSPVTMSGSSLIQTTGGAKTNIVSSSEGTFSGTATISPAPNLGTAAVSDPFSSMNPPTVGACTYGSPVVVTTNTTLSEGTYCGGIITSGTETITLNPGTYIIESGITESGSPTFNGSGVTLYFKSGGITGSGTGGFNLSAPTSGTYQGVVIFEDRSNSSGITLSGSTGTQVNGLVYMPNGNLTYSGYSGTSGVVTTLVVKAITFSGTSYISQPATTAYGGGGGRVALIQ